MRAKDVMSSGIITVGSESPVLQAARLMLQNRISGLPVVDSTGRLAGIVTEGDFLRRSELGTQRRRARWLEFLMGPGKIAGEYAHAGGRKVDEVMTPEVHTVTEDTPLSDVVETMERYHVKRVPVVRGEKPVGMVTRANLLRAFAAAAHEFPPPLTSDSAIREALMATLKQESWAPAAAMDVSVADGVVTLTGVILDNRQRTALHVAAENIPGVKKIDDRLVWIEPMSGMVLDAAESKPAA